MKIDQFNPMMGAMAMLVIVTTTDAFDNLTMMDTQEPNLTNLCPLQVRVGALPQIRPTLHPRKLNIANNRDGRTAVFTMPTSLTITSVDSTNQPGDQEQLQNGEDPTVSQDSGLFGLGDGGETDNNLSNGDEDISEDENEDEDGEVGEVGEDDEEDDDQDDQEDDNEDDRDDDEDDDDDDDDDKVQVNRVNIGHGDQEVSISHVGGGNSTMAPDNGDPEKDDEKKQKDNTKDNKTHEKEKDRQKQKEKPKGEFPKEKERDKEKEKEKEKDKHHRPHLIETNSTDIHNKSGTHQRIPLVPTPVNYHPVGLIPKSKTNEGAAISSARSSVLSMVGVGLVFGAFLAAVQSPGAW